MRRRIFLVIATLLSSCSGEQPSKTIVHDTVHDVDFSIEHTSEPALSQAEDRGYATMGNKRELVFEGYGASRIAIKPLREGVVVVEYYGGSIRKTGSFLASRTGSGNAVAVRVQPVVIANVEIAGNRIYAE